MNKCLDNKRKHFWLRLISIVSWPVLIYFTYIGMYYDCLWAENVAVFFSIFFGMIGYLNFIMFTSKELAMYRTWGSFVILPMAWTQLILLAYGGWWVTFALYAGAVLTNVKCMLVKKEKNLDGDEKNS